MLPVYIKNLQQSRGFTLLEIVVAIGIFAVISIVAHSSLSQFLSAREVMENNSKTFAQVNRGVSLLEQDIQYAVPHTIRDEYGDIETAFIANASDPDIDNEVLRLTTALPSYQIDNTSRLSRVVWRLEDGVLIRSFWLVLDRAQDSEVEHIKLIDDVESFAVTAKVYDEDGDLQLVDLEDSEAQVNTMPAAIEMTLKLGSGKEYFRIWQVISEI